MKKFQILILIIIFSGCKSIKAQHKGDCNHVIDRELNKEIYSDPDILPQFQEGLVGFNKFLMKNFKYPDQDTFQGQIKYSVVIDNDGQLIDAKIYGKKEEGYTPFDKEAIRVIKLSPKWKPGECSGRKIAVRMTIPVRL